jgi:hypothetical protein
LQASLPLPPPPLLLGNTTPASYALVCDGHPKGVYAALNGTIVECGHPPPTNNGTSSTDAPKQHKWVLPAAIAVGTLFSLLLLGCLVWLVFFTRRHRSAKVKPRGDDHDSDGDDEFDIDPETGEVKVKPQPKASASKALLLSSPSSSSSSKPAQAVAQPPSTGAADDVETSASSTSKDKKAQGGDATDEQLRLSPVSGAQPQPQHPEEQEHAQPQQAGQQAEAKDRGPHPDDAHLPPLLQQLLANAPTETGQQQQQHQQHQQQGQAEPQRHDHHLRLFPL